CPSHAVRVIQRAFDYDYPTDQYGNRRAQKETTYFGATDSSGACGACPFHSVEYLPTETASPGRWEQEGRHFDQERHDGNLGGDYRLITTGWAPANWTTLAGGPVLPNLFNAKTTADSSGSVTTSYSFSAYGFLNSTTTNDPNYGSLVQIFPSAGGDGRGDGR